MWFNKHKNVFQLTLVLWWQGERDSVNQQQDCHVAGDVEAWSGGELSCSYRNRLLGHGLRVSTWFMWVGGCCICCCYLLCSLCSWCCVRKHVSTAVSKEVTCSQVLYMMVRPIGNLAPLGATSWLWQFLPQKHVSTHNTLCQRVS